MIDLNDRPVSAAKRQRITTIKEDAMPAKELPALTATPADLEAFKSQRLARAERRTKIADLIKLFDAVAELRVSPPIFEHEEPGALETLRTWATGRGLAVVDTEHEVIGGRFNMVTRAHTIANHAIEVYWTREEQAA